MERSITNELHIRERLVASWGTSAKCVDWPSFGLSRNREGSCARIWKVATDNRGAECDRQGTPDHTVAKRLARNELKPSAMRLI